MLAVSACAVEPVRRDSSPIQPPVQPIGVQRPTESSTDTDSSLPAGIPTVEPTSPASVAPGSTTDMSARLTIVNFDTASSGLLVGGFVSGVIESGGDCQFVVTRDDGSEYIVRTVGVENVSSTSCGSTLVPAEAVPSGNYVVELRYGSGRGEAWSDAIPVSVP